LSKGRPVGHAVPRAEGVDEQGEEVVEGEVRVGQVGVRRELLDGHDPAVLGEVADPHEVDEGDVDVAPGHEVAHLLAERVLIRDGGDVDDDARGFRELRDHLEGRRVAGPVEEQHLELGARVGRGRRLERPLRVLSHGTRAQSRPERQRARPQ
jgi:hypothetical protein